jgi:hypothetical protein
MVLRRDEATNGWITLHNEELRNLYSLPSIFGITKPKGMKLARHVARIREKRNTIGYCWESQNERDYQQDTDTRDSWIILRQSLKK